MGFLTKLKSMLPWLTSASAPWLQDTGVTLPLELSRENYWEAYEKHSRTRACIDRVADALCSLPMLVEVQGGEDWEEVTDQNDLRALLDYVNKRQDWQGLLKQTVITLMLYGNSYWILERGASGQVVELTAVSEAVANIEVQLVDGDVAAYKFAWNGGGQAIVDVADIVNFCMPSPLSPSSIVGASSIAPIASLIEQDWAMAKYNIDYFNNGATPGVILSIKGRVPQNQRDSFERDFKKRFGNKTTPHRTMVVGSDGGAEVSHVGDNPQESSFLATHESIKADIAEALGVPESFLKPSAKYANSKEDTRRFYQGKVFPLASLIEAAINEQLSPQFGEGLRVRFDVNLPDLLLDEQMQKAEMTAKLVGNKAIMTVDKARELFWELGPMEDDPGYEEPQPMPAALQAAQAPAAPDQPALPPEAKQKALLEHYPDNKLTEPTEARLARVVRL